MSRKRANHLFKWIVAILAIVTLFHVPAWAQTVIPSEGLNVPYTGLVNPIAVASDSAGNLYVAELDQPGSSIGVVLRMPAGGSSFQRFFTGATNPSGLSLDSQGNLYVADQTSGSIFRVTPAGTATTVETGLNQPGGMAVDAAGDIYVAETINGQVVEFGASGGTKVLLSNNVPLDVALDSAGNLYVAVQQGENAGVVKIEPNGAQSKIGSGLSSADSVTVDSSGDVFAADGNGTIFEITSDGTQFTIPTRQGEVFGLALDAQNDLYIPSFQAGTIAKLTHGGGSINLGSANVCATGQSSPSPCSQSAALTYNVTASGTLGTPKALTLGVPNLDFSIASTTCSGAVTAGSTCTVNVTFAPKARGARNGAVQIVDNSGNVLTTTLVYGTASGPQIAFAPPALKTLFSNVSVGGVAFDAIGNIYIAEGDSRQTVKFTPAGGSQFTQTVVQNDGANSSPLGVAVDGSGNVYIADEGGGGIVKETPISGGYTESTVLTGLASAISVAVDGAGNIYACDHGDGGANGSVVKLTPSANGYVKSTVASGLGAPYSVAVDGAGNVYIANFSSNSVFREAPSATGYVQSTIGSGLLSPVAVAVDASGNVYIADLGNFRTLKETFAKGTYTQSVIASGDGPPGAVAVDAAQNVYFTNSNSPEQFYELDSADPPSFTFPTTAVGATSASNSATIENIGDTALAMSGLSVATNFTQIDGPGNPEDCTSSVSLAAGAECNLSLSFAPTTAGTIQGSAVLSDNALNGNPAMQTINLNGTATDVVASFSITGLVGTTVGTGENFTITALDPKGNVDVNFSGTVNIISSDPQGEGIRSVTLTNGVDALSDAWKFQTAGSQTLTVTDSADSIVSTSAPVLITAGPASSMAIVQGSGQSATVNTAFATPLQVVVKDQFGNPVSGATVTFTAQSTGASAALSTPAVTAADGTTSVTATANATAGSYNVNVTSTRLASARFALTNTHASQTITFPQPASPISYSSGLAVTLNATASSTLAVTYSVVSGPATVSGSTLTITGAGTVVVEADQAGNSTYAAATAVQDSIVVNPASQTVNITGLPATATYGAGPYTLSATSTSGSTPTFSVTGPASISGSTLTITGTGNVVVTASVTASANYSAASASQTIVVSAASQTITFANPGGQNFGTNPTMTATASSGLAVNFTSLTPSVCTITSGGALIFGTAGICTIHADQAGDLNHAAAPTVSQSFTVNAVIPGAPTIGTATAGNGQATVSFTAPASNGGAAISAYTVISSPGGVVGTGSSSPVTLTGLTNGTAYTFTVNAINSAGTSAASAASNSVTPVGTQTISFTGLPTAATYGAAGPYTLNATATSGLPVSYSVSGPATVSGNILTVNGAGTILVTASQAGNAGYTAAASVSQTIVVSAASQTVNFTGLPSTATYGSAGPYTLAATSTSGSTPTFSVTGPASISGNTLTITGTGSVVVTASVAASANYTAASASQTIVVSAASQTVNFTGLPTTATYGSAGPYTLAATSTSGSTPTFSVIGPASISGHTLTITGAGSVVVTASVAASANYTAASASQTIVVSAASQTVNFTGLPTTATYGSAGPYTLNGTATSGLAVSYSVTGPATVAGNTLTITGAGTVIVTASQAGNGNYKAAASVSQTIVVSNPTSTYDAAITVQYASTQLVYPGATNITVCIAPAHNITATGSVQIYDGTTLLTTLSVQGGGCAYWYISPGLAAGDHVLTAVYSGDKNNPEGTSAPTTIHVAPVPVNMAPSCWLTNSGYGASYQCTVSLSSNAGSAQGVMTYSYDGGTAVSVAINNGTANFTLTRPAAGNHTVQAAYAQQTNYAAAGPVTENFTVAPAQVQVALTPSSWYTSASGGISFSAAVNSSSAGAPSNGSVEFFDGTILLATVPVNANGQASYSTTKLATGSHTIAATYSGGVNYASGSSSVTITLTP